MLNRAALLNSAGVTVLAVSAALTLACALLPPLAR